LKYEESAIIAAKEGHDEVVRMLLAATDESLLNGSSALANAAEVQYTAIVGMLLEKWPAVSNSHYNSREGALCIAAERGQ
jgi:hypothetical protein